MIKLFKYVFCVMFFLTTHLTYAETSEQVLPDYSAPHVSTQYEVHDEPQTPNFKEDAASHVFPASQLPIEESSDKFTSELLNMLITLGMLIAVIFALSYILKRMLTVKTQKENYKSTIKVVEKRSLSPKAALYLVEVYNRTLVIAESPTGFTCMTTFDHTEEEAENAPAKESKSFEKILDQTK